MPPRTSCRSGTTPWPCMALKADGGRSRSRPRVLSARRAGVLQLGAANVPQPEFESLSLQQARNLFGVRAELVPDRRPMKSVRLSRRYGLPPPSGVRRERRRRLQIDPFGRERSWMLPIYAIHRHALLWERPNAFDPDRFAPEAGRGRNRFSYLPFGAGPRACIGASFRDDGGADHPCDPAGALLVSSCPPISAGAADVADASSGGWDAAFGCPDMLTTDRAPVEQMHDRLRGNVWELRWAVSVRPTAAPQAPALGCTGSRLEVSPH